MKKFMRPKAERQAWWRSLSQQEKEYYINKKIDEKQSKRTNESNESVLMGITYPTDFSLPVRPDNILPWD